MTTTPFELYKKFVENGQLKVEICLKKKHHPSTNILLIRYESSNKNRLSLDTLDSF